MMLVGLGAIVIFALGFILGFTVAEELSRD